MHAVPAKKAVSVRLIGNKIVKLAVEQLISWIDKRSSRFYAHRTRYGFDHNTFISIWRSDTRSARDPSHGSSLAIRREQRPRSRRKIGKPVGVHHRDDHARQAVQEGASRP